MDRVLFCILLKFVYNLVIERGIEMKPTIKTWILTELTDKQKQQIPEIFDVIYQPTIENDVLQEMEVIVGRPPIGQLPYAKSLKWLQLDSAGSEQYCVEGLLPKDYLLTNATGSFGLTISEYLICTILMLMRNMNLYIRNQLTHTWQVEGPIYSIYGSTFLIVGTGNLGLEFAKRIKALGGTTIGIKKHVEEVPYFDEVHPMSDMEQLLPKADVVVMALPSTASTKGCFHTEYFDLMKTNAIWANVGRGDVVQTMDVYHAVKNKHILGAILDVCEVEPIPKEHPIWQEENIIITPHISGTFQLPKTKDIFVELLINNMKAYDQNETLINMVDVKEGYRSYDLKKS